MRGRDSIVVVVFLTVIAAPAVAQLISPGDSVTRQIAGHARDSVFLTLNDGDFAEVGMTGRSGLSVAVSRPDGSPLRSFEEDIQLVAEGSGRYGVVIVNDSSAPARYALAFRRRVSLAERTSAGAIRDTILSPRMRALRRELASNGGDTGAFWQTVSRDGTPLVEPSDAKYDLVTFVWRAVNETRNVFLRTTFSVPSEENGRTYFFQRLDSTDIWFLTLQIPKGARFLYRLEPNRPWEPSEFPSATAQRDPYNMRTRCPGDGSKYSCSSIGELPDAPPEPLFVRTPGLPAGHVERKSIRSALQNVERPLTIYTPVNYSAEKGPVPLLVLFDGDDFLDTDDWHGLEIWDNLIAQKKIPPTVVVMVHNLPGRRLFDLVANRTFGDFMAKELVPWVRANYKVSPSAARTVVGGASAGGLSAAYLGIAHPEVFGNVLSMSGAFWWSPAHNGGICAGLCATPNERPAVINQDATTELNWVAQLALDHPPQNVRFYLGAGTFEFDDSGTGGAILEETRHLRDILRAQHNVVFYEQFPSGHDGRSWPAMLASGLQHLLGQ
ncbi:MAG TPA: alpha/beta hydrolase-fold protein [Gemmatimonadaceae bacterium]|nr:alpha/beta hydrolase-fold protein [Gemmatimonadaceae bacterium]